MNEIERVKEAILWVAQFANLGTDHVEKILKGEEPKRKSIVDEVVEKILNDHRFTTPVLHHKPDSPTRKADIEIREILQGYDITEKSPHIPSKGFGEIMQEIMAEKPDAIPELLPKDKPEAPDFDKYLDEPPTDGPVGPLLDKMEKDALDGLSLEPADELIEEFLKTEPKQSKLLDVIRQLRYLDTRKVDKDILDDCRKEILTKHWPKESK